jgi:hypothetical protein
MSPHVDRYRPLVSLALSFTILGATAAELRQTPSAFAGTSPTVHAAQADPAAPQAEPQLSPHPVLSRPRLWQLEESEIKNMGNGSFDAGLNEVGRLGYQLFIVTSELESGRVGFHLFTVPRWNLPMPAPTYEFKRIDRESIDKLGNGKLTDGFKVLEGEGWNLSTVTTIKNGAIGWYYFEREIRNP